MRISRELAGLALLANYPKDLPLLSSILGFPDSTAGWLLEFLTWFVIWTPAIALIEYAAHRWIMHMANRLLDPKLRQLSAHGTHHEGTNESEFVDMPWRNCLLLVSPLLLFMIAWGAAIGSVGSIVIPCAALLAWTFFYAYLWTRIHRAIHGVESNWFGRSTFFRFFRDHHLKHHVHATVNYGTVFPWSDYLFFTWHRPRKLPSGKGEKGQSCKVAELQSTDGAD